MTITAIFLYSAMAASQPMEFLEHGKKWGLPDNSWRSQTVEVCDVRSGKHYEATAVMYVRENIAGRHIVATIPENKFLYVRYRSGAASAADLSDQATRKNMSAEEVARCGVI